MGTCDSASVQQRFHFDGGTGLFTSFYEAKLLTVSDGTLHCGSELAYWTGWTG